MNPFFLSEVDHTWTLFLDRDGVINERVPNDYIKRPEDFIFIEGVQGALIVLAKIFPRIIVLTNQRGIGRGLMTENALSEVHHHFRKEVRTYGGRIDKIIYCPHDISDKCDCRKPQVGMALAAQADIEGIVFGKSIMVGDSHSDMEMAKQLGISKVFVESEHSEAYPEADLIVQSLSEFAEKLRTEMPQN